MLLHASELNLCVPLGLAFRLSSAPPCRSLAMKRSLAERPSSTVEAKLIARSQFEAQYEPQEKIRAVVVENFPMLGR